MPHNDLGEVDTDAFEAITISVPQGQKATFNEPHFLSFTRFDGTRIQI